MTEKSKIERPLQTRLDNGMANSRPVKLGWSTEEIGEIMEALNQLLANYSVHYQKLRNFHWNVKGSDFFDLHNEFESQYMEAHQHIDAIAERIRYFGKTPLSTMREFLENAKIEEAGSSLDSDFMIREVLHDYRVLLEQMFKGVEVAQGISDSGTEEMIKSFIGKMEKHHWMLSAFLAS